jgi:hypothetical protein
MKKQIALAVSLAFVGTAVADSHNEKKGDAMKKAPEAKKEAPAIKAPEPPKTMEQPKPPPEVAAMAAMMAGNWKCTGKGMMDPSKPDMTEFKGGMKAALDASLDKFWIKGEWNGTAGKLKMKGTMYVTFDPMTKKYHRIMVDNWGMSGSDSTTGLPAGAKEGKISWEGESRMGGQMIKGRTTEDVTAKSMKMTAEMTMDGKKWVTGMEMTCTK